MPATRILNIDSDEAMAVLAPHITMNENALELYNQRLTALFPNDVAKVNQLLILRKNDVACHFVSLWHVISSSFYYLE
jgi:hypothetical protein